MSHHYENKGKTGQESVMVVSSASILSPPSDHHHHINSIDPTCNNQFNGFP